MESGRIVDTASADAQLHDTIRAASAPTTGSAARDRWEDGDLVVGAYTVAVEGRFAVAPHSTALHEGREIGAIPGGGVGDDLTDSGTVDVGATRARGDPHRSEQTQSCHRASVRMGTRSDPRVSSRSVMVPECCDCSSYDTANPSGTRSVDGRARPTHRCPTSGGHRRASRPALSLRPPREQHHRSPAS